MLNLLTQVFVHGIPAAIALAGASVVAHWTRQQLRARWVRAVVTGHAESSDSEGPVFRSRFEYEAAGRRWEVLDEAGFGWRAHRVGQVIRVGVPDGNPSAGRPWRVWPVVAGVGLVAAGAGVLAMTL